VHTVAEDGGDGEATWALDVHEEAARARDKCLNTLLVTPFAAFVEVMLREAVSASDEAHSRRY